MKSTPVIVERVYPSSVNEVWDALTDNEKLRQWYFKLPEFKPVVGFEFSFVAGKDPDHPYHHVCVITDIVPLKKIAYTWRYEGYPGNSQVAFELFNEGANTRVRITHTGVESFAQNGPDFASESFAGGWTYFLDQALKNFLAA